MWDDASECLLSAMQHPATGSQRFSQRRNNASLRVRLCVAIHSHFGRRTDSPANVSVLLCSVPVCRTEQPLPPVVDRSNRMPADYRSPDQRISLTGRLIQNRVRTAYSPSSHNVSIQIDRDQNPRIGRFLLSLLLSIVYNTVILVSRVINSLKMFDGRPWSKHYIGQAVIARTEESPSR
jgi:hypothetical protein